MADGKSDNLAKQINNVEDSTKELKTFHQNAYTVNYQNTSKIIFHPSSTGSQITLNNIHCHNQGRKFWKVTEIAYGDKLIRIQDFFQVSLDHEKQKTLKANQSIKKVDQTSGKVRIFTKNDLRNKFIKNDKKNIVKNIVRIFRVWLEREQNQPQFDKVFRELQSLIDISKFNNKLIKHMLADIRISKLFFKFLKQSAKDQIKYSKIKDKASHYEAIKLYINLVVDSKDSHNLDQPESSNQFQQTNKKIKKHNQKNKKQKIRYSPTAQKELFINKI